MKVSMFSDLRMLTGDPSLEIKLKSHVAGRLRDNEFYLGHMTANLLHFAVPLGWFGRIRTEKGEHAGKVDLKKAGIFAITEGIKILSLGNGVQETATAERIKRLIALGVLRQKEADDLIASYYSLVYYRLRSQVDASSAGRQQDNRITLGGLNRMKLP